MERVFSPDDRIRRAEEIYRKRQSLRERTKRATLNVSETPKNYRIVKKLTLQIVICLLLYCMFYLINTTNYNFSEATIAKVKEIVSIDYDFYGVYNNMVQSLNTYLYKDLNNNEEGKEDTENQPENQEETSEQNESTQTAMINESVIDEEESLTQSEISKTEESETDRIRRSYEFILPVTGIVSSEYGQREVNASVITAYHKGIDVGANTGTKIFAATDGEVVIAKRSPSYGNYIMLQNNEVKTVYAHCNKLLVRSSGIRCQKGRRLQKLAQHGDVTGPHLHFEIRVNDVCIDPRLMIEF